MGLAGYRAAESERGGCLWGWVALALALPHLIDVNKYRGQVQAQLQQRLNRPVQLGQMSLICWGRAQRTYP